VQLEGRAPLRRALDDPHERASVDLLELEHHLAVVLPVQDEPLLRVGSASHTSAGDAGKTTSRSICTVFLLSLDTQPGGCV
jgi:hypothetical protein